MDKRVDDETSSSSQPTVALSALLVTFLKLGASSFGGGTSGWMHREVVEHRQWLSNENFLKTMTVTQVMPGANAVNLAVYIGLQLRGYAGAAVAGFGIVTPAFCIILLLALLYQRISGYPEANAVLRGLACVGIASTLAMGIKTSSRLKGKFIPICIAFGIFVAVGVLRVPLIQSIVVVTPFSVLAAYIMERRRRTNG